MERLRRLLCYLVDQLQDQEAPISTIRLVKLLYLIDLEHYRRFGEPLTGVKWVRYHYGPYFMEFPAVLKAARLDLEPEEVRTEHGPGRTFRFYGEPQDIADIVSYSAESIISQVIKTWALEDLDVLLEHVYRTKPVQLAKHDEALDFTLETDVLAAREAFDEIQESGDFVTIEDLFAEFGNPHDAL